MNRSLLFLLFFVGAVFNRDVIADDFINLLFAGSATVASTPPTVCPTCTEGQPSALILNFSSSGDSYCGPTELDNIYYWTYCLETNVWEWTTEDIRHSFDVTYSNGLCRVQAYGNSCYFEVNNVAISCDGTNLCGVYHLVDKTTEPDNTNSLDLVFGGCQPSYQSPLGACVQLGTNGVITGIGDKLFLGFNDLIAFSDNGGAFTSTFASVGSYIVNAANYLWTEGPFLSNGVQYSYSTPGEVWGSVSCLYNASGVTTNCTPLGYGGRFCPAPAVNASLVGRWLNP